MDLLREIADELDRLAASGEYRAEQEVLGGYKQFKLAKKMLAKARSMKESDVGALARVISDWASPESRIQKLVNDLYR